MKRPRTRERDSREPVFIKPNPTDTEDDVVNALMDALVPIVNAARAELGLPPLADDDPPESERRRVVR